MHNSLVGDRVHDFLIESKLAEGGMGAVYIARHTRIPGIRKVVKVLLHNCSRNPELRARFEREARAAARLRHDGILEIDNYGVLPDGSPWLMTKYLDGESLEEVVHRGPMDEAHALAIILQLCSAMQHAHLAGVIHRDLKPGNVFVCQGRIKVLDFGIAKLLDEYDDGARTQSGISIGTPAYMAVEQYQSADTATAAADIYSIAIMVTELVTGHRPWTLAEPAIMYMRQKHEPPNLSGLSAGWQRIVKSALAANPTERPVSAKAFGIALAHELADGVTIMSTVTPEFLRDTPIRLSSPDALTLPPSPVTTMSLATGAVPAQPSVIHWKLAAAGAAICALASWIVFLVSHLPTTVPMQPAARTEMILPVIAAPAVDAHVAPDAPPPPPPPDARIVRHVVPPKTTQAPPKPPAPIVLPNDDFDPTSPTGK